MQLRRLFCCLLVVFAATSVFAQQTGALHGRVTASDGSALPGVTVEAKSNALPQPRVTVSDSNGDYRLPQLQPGVYTLTFTLSGMQSTTRRAEVILSSDAEVNAKLGVAGVSEAITVTAEATLVDKENTSIQNGLSNSEFSALPVAQEYKDLQKLIPGVMYSQDQTRGPSAGGSGQDNVYLFDGVNVTMPLFGVLVAEPNTHDILQSTVIRGGARAVDFDRSGGFVIDSVSKSGTNKFTGEVQYQIKNHSMIANQTVATNNKFQQDRDWITLDGGGPIISDRLFFYGSYYQPDYTRNNQANNYGPLPSYTLKAKEEFGKATFTPTASWLINASYRNKHTEQTGDTFGVSQAGTTGFGSETRLKIGTLESSWIINPKSYATLKYTDFRNPGTGRPSNFSSAVPNLTIGTHLDIANLNQLGLLTVPTLITGNAVQNAFVQPFIDKYGFVNGAGVHVGGGLVGTSSLAADDDNFFRKSGQVGYNLTFGSAITHDFHVGYQRYNDSEDRFQLSNGWGSITIPGGSVNCPASACGSLKPGFFVAAVNQQGLGAAPVIHSEYHSQSFEINDVIHVQNWTYNVGVMASNDTLYGQGLTPASNIAGFVKSPGTKYKMHDTPFRDMIQPRLGATWAYNGQDTLFASYARYNPAANSDARAASWDRNLQQSLNVYFDANGNLLGVDPVKSSSGKLFVPGIKPRETNEIMLGTAQQIGTGFSVRAYARYRKADRFWEDTNNDARIRFGAGVPGVNQNLYVPDLAAKLAAIGSGSTYVIAELDGAFTKYYEGTTEAEWRGQKAWLKGSYTLSHYYGNFDQDNTSFNTANDASLFIGSSNIGDGAGRQLWNFKYGDLRGDRRNVLKLYGAYTLPWNATTGGFALYQSGQPYQLESFLPYTALTANTSDTNRYAEPAGRRKSPSHYQVDWNYTQNFGLPKGLNLQIKADLFNVFNKQTGYNYETRVGTIGTCNPTTSSTCYATGLTGAAGYLAKAPFPKSFYDPRAFQIAANIQF
jgi:hypothetical protein